MVKGDKKIGILPSPYSVVTSYENAFVKKFNDNIAGAVADVLKYIAQATASSIKNIDATDKEDKSNNQKL